jgi:uncharacterized protein YdiU (UPF0061 family)
VGTFQFLAARDEVDNLRSLADYAIQRHAPELSDEPDKYLMFLRSVILRQAQLIAKWQMVGFIHGVMNTDNMAISGETIDYGPCAFMDVYHPETVFSSIDHGGRYAYVNQPGIGQWNLARFAETLLPLIDPSQERAIEAATEELSEYPKLFEQYWLSGMRKKLGLQIEASGDGQLVTDLLAWMQSVSADFTNTFDDLFNQDLAAHVSYQDEHFRAWHTRWRERLTSEGNTPESVRSVMKQANPAVIPRNHRVEDALAAATEQDDLSVMHQLLETLASPFDRSKAHPTYRTPPPPGNCYRTFCGT